MAGYTSATVRLQKSYTLAKFELRIGYTLATDRRHIAFGLLSRSRPTLRLVRAVIRTKDYFLAAGDGLADPPRVDTPYAPTRCRQTRMQPRKFGMTGSLQGTTPRAQTRMAAR